MHWMLLVLETLYESRVYCVESAGVLLGVSTRLSFETLAPVWHRPDTRLDCQAL